MEQVESIVNMNRLSQVVEKVEAVFIEEELISLEREIVLQQLNSRTLARKQQEQVKDNMSAILPGWASKLLNRKSAPGEEDPDDR